MGWNARQANPMLTSIQNVDRKQTGRGSWDSFSSSVVGLGPHLVPFVSDRRLMLTRFAKRGAAERSGFRVRNSVGATL